VDAHLGRKTANNEREQSDPIVEDRWFLLINVLDNQLFIFRNDLDSANSRSLQADLVSPEREKDSMQNLRKKNSVHNRI